jgi:uncharacterized membrane protein
MRHLGRQIRPAWGLAGKLQPRLSEVAQKRKKKRAVVSRREAASVWLVVVGLFVSLTAALWLLQRDYSGPVEGQPVDNANLTLQISDLAEGELRVFSYPVGRGRHTQFFVRRRTGNSVLVAFATCRRCYKSGASLHGNQLYCRHCRRPMRIINPSEEPETEADCSTIPPPYELSEGRLVVQGSTIKSEFRRWFQPVLDDD